MAYNAIDIAKKIICKTDMEHGDTISNLKLQKLLYYMQGFHLAFFGTPFFNESIDIECAPTFMRMMVADGSYEKLLEAEKHRFKVLAEKRISDLNDNINTEVMISTEKNRQRHEAEIQANKELMEKIAKAQAELLQTAIDKWREEELAKINENPSVYFKTDNT